MDKSIYKRPNKPRTTKGKHRPLKPVLKADEIASPIEVHYSTECHVTPPDVAARMVNYLQASPDCLTLEPSAGTGSILQALLDSGHSAVETIAIEQHQSLCKAIRQRFKGRQEVTLMERCFLEYAAFAVGKCEYPRIIMNPPFRYVKKHIEAALSLLGTHGHDSAVLVALVPITYEHPEAETIEILPNTTFANAAVNTKIIRIASFKPEFYL